MVQRLALARLVAALAVVVAVPAAGPLALLQTAPASVEPRLAQVPHEGPLRAVLIAAGGKLAGEAADRPVAQVAPVLAAPPPQLPLHEQRGQEALARLTYPWQQLGWTITFEPGRPGYLGMAYPDERRIVVWVREQQSVEHVASVVAHELGHAIDVTYGTPERRAQWLALRGLPAGTAWFGCGACTDFATPAGDFAEVFSYWQTGVEYQSELAAYPAPEALAALVPLFQPSG